MEIIDFTVREEEKDSGGVGGRQKHEEFKIVNACKEGRSPVVSQAQLEVGEKGSDSWLCGENNLKQSPTTLKEEKGVRRHEDYWKSV